MKIIQKSFNDIILLEPDIFEDERGYFFESFNNKRFNKLIGRNINFVQDNHSFSYRGVLRGLHFQNPSPQAKLVRVLGGKVYDVVVDIRKSSPTFGNWAGFYLDSVKNNMLWIPEGYAHGFQVISDKAHFLYKTNNYWDGQAEQSLKWDDLALNIEWPISKPILSKKDKCAPGIDEIDLFD